MTTTDDLETRLRTDHLVIDVWLKGERRSLDYAELPYSEAEVGERVMELIERLAARNR